MKRYLILSIALLSTFGCRKTNSEGNCAVEFKQTVDGATNVVTRSQQYDIPTDVANWSMEVISRADGKVVYSAPTFNSGVSLVRGDLNVTLRSVPATDATFEAPMYAGSADFSSTPDQATSVDVACKLSCVVVDVSYSENIKNRFVSYRTTVWGNGTDRLLYDELKSGELGYFSVAKVLNYKIEVVTDQGFLFSKTGTVADLRAGDLLQLDFDIDQAVKPDTDPLVVDLILDQSINEVLQTIELGVTMESTKVPMVTGRGVELSEPIGVQYKIGSTVQIDVITDGGLKKVLFLFGGDTPLTVDVVKDGASVGVTFIENGQVGAKSSLMDLTEFTKMLPGSMSGSQTSTITIGVLDLNGQYFARDIMFNVYGVPITTLGFTGNDVIDWFGERGERNMVNMTIEGRYNVDTEPSGMEFNYRKKGEPIWQSVAVDVNQSTKTVTANISIPAGGQTWEYKLISDNAAADTKEFTTIGYPTIDNMSFDTWSGGDYSNPTGGWSSPNANAVIDKVITTTEAEGWNGSGKSARIRSVVAVGNFASGGLFTGSMTVVMPPNAYKSAQVGVPFIGRPKKLVGYYKYTGKKIDKYNDGAAAGNGAVNGGDDMCEICVKLEKWNGGDYKIRWKDGLFGNVGGSYTYAAGVENHPRFAKVADYDGNNGTFDADIRSKIAVGYGQLTSYGKDDWTRFEIDITYSQDVMPDRVIITAVSSAWGGYMTGGVGSTLNVDNFEFIY